MQFKNYFHSKLPFFVALSFAFVIASCGSYQYVGNDNDGIYSSEEIIHQEDSYEDAKPASNDSYYKNYFGEKAEQYNAVPEEDIIFTDIDSYVGDYDEENEDADYDSGWGQNSSEITISVYPSYGYYNSGWNRFGIGWYNSYWGYPYYNVGFGYPFYGYGYGGFYSNFWCPPNYFSYGYYGNAYHSPYYNYGYNNSYRSRVAYNAGRRGSVNTLNNRSTINRRNSSTIRRSTSNTSRPRTTTRRNKKTIRSSSTSRPRVNSTPRRNTSRSTTTRRSTRSSSSMSSGSSRSSSRGSSARSSSSRRSSSGTSSSGSSRRR